MEEPVSIFKNKKLSELEQSIQNHPAGKKTPRLTPAVQQAPPKPVRNLRRVR